MSKMTPDPGTLFYAESRKTLTRQIGSGDTAVAVRDKDRSFAEVVFRCVAFDDRAVIADIVWGDRYCDTKRMLLRSEYTFHPVGPEVVAALGLSA